MKCEIGARDGLGARLRNISTAARPIPSRTPPPGSGAGMPGVTRALEAKYWVDEIYQAAIVEPLRSVGQAFFWIDRFVVDGLVWATSFVPMLGGFALKLSTQRGYLQGYAAVMLLGIAIILMVIFL